MARKLGAHGIIGRHNPLTRSLYIGEKWIYKNADAVVMTWPGGKQYIIDNGWHEEIQLEKVYHISNGVVLEAFDYNSIEYPVNDPGPWRPAVLQGCLRWFHKKGQQCRAYSGCSESCS